jgi:hypothetical protein
MGRLARGALLKGGFGVAHDPIFDCLQLAEVAYKNDGHVTESE